MLYYICGEHANAEEEDIQVGLVQRLSKRGQRAQTVVPQSNKDAAFITRGRCRQIGFGHRLPRSGPQLHRTT